VIGAHVLELAGDRVDLAVELIDQHEARFDVIQPGLGHLEAREQLTAGDTEQVGDRARLAERDQSRVDAVLEARAMTHQVQAKARELALTAHLRVGQPDRRHQVTKRELGQHARVDLVGLARQRREPLHALRVGDQYVPALRLERVVHEPRAVHRLDRSTPPWSAS
jgi:hypothetical protein